MQINSQFWKIDAASPIIIFLGTIWTKLRPTVMFRYYTYSRCIQKLGAAFSLQTSENNLQPRNHFKRQSEGCQWTMALEGSSYMYINLWPMGASWKMFLQISENILMVSDNKYSINSFAIMIGLLSSEMLIRFFLFFFYKQKIHNKRTHKHMKRKLKDALIWNGILW